MIGKHMKYIRCVSLVLILISLVLCIMLSSCGSSDESEILWAFSGNTKSTEIAELIEEYEKENNVTVKIEDIHDISQGDHDLVTFTDTDEIKGCEDSFSDLTAENISGYVPHKSLMCFDESGKARALPSQVTAYGIICNKSLLKKADIDTENLKTLRDIKSAAKKIHDTRFDTFDAFPAMSLKKGCDDMITSLLLTLRDTEKFYDGETLSGEYIESMREIVNMMLSFSSADMSTLPYVEYDPVSEFSKKHAAMCFGSDDDIRQYTDEFGMNEKDLVLIPLFYGIDDENQGYAYKVQSFTAVKDDIPDEKKEAVYDMLSYVLADSAGEKYKDSRDIIKMSDDASDEYREKLRAALVSFVSEEEHTFSDAAEVLTGAYDETVNNKE